MTKETHPHWNYPAARRADREGHRLACEDLARMHPSQLDVGNPNHPIHDGIFGYETKEFLRKQMNSL